MGEEEVEVEEEGEEDLEMGRQSHQLLGKVCLFPGYKAGHLAAEEMGLSLSNTCG